MSKINPKVDAFFSKNKKWTTELEAIRMIMHECDLNEELKWGKPCYTYNDTNLFILQGFKEFCALLFTNGALLSDPENVLEKPGENTHAARRIPFTDVSQIISLQPILKSYIMEAIAKEKAGLKVETDSKSSFVLCEEFQNYLDGDQNLKTAFESLTPGRQRLYNMHFSAAKQSKTRLSRIEKCIPQILDGKGLND